MAAHAEAVRNNYEAYLLSRTLYYRAEQRWPGSQFWGRRQEHGRPGHA